MKPDPPESGSGGGAAALEAKAKQCLMASGAFERTVAPARSPARLDSLEW